MKAVGRAWILALAVAAALAPVLAQTPAPVKLQPPLLMGPGIPLNIYLDYLDLERDLNRLLQKPCLTAADQAEALARAKAWVEYMLKFAKDYALNKVAEQEANDYAELLLRKYQQIQNKKICPPGTGGSTPPPVTPPGKGASGGTATGGGGQGTPPPKDGPAPTDPKKCDDPKDNEKKIAAARKQFNDAQSALIVIEQQLGELSAELAAQKKIVSNYGDPLSHDLKQDGEVEKNQQWQDANRRIGEIEREMKELDDVRRKAQQMQQEAMDELKKYGVDPFGPCEPNDELMMLPSVPEGLNASLPVPPQTALAAVFETADLASAVVANPLAGSNVCCEPGVQKLIITIRRKSAPAPRAVVERSRDWLTLLARFVRGFPIAALEASTRIEQAAADPQPGSLQAVITSLGESQGDAFRIQVLNEWSRPVRLSADGVVVEPIKREAGGEAQRALERITPRLKNAQTATAEGYCLMYASNPPPAGMLFRVAPPAVQAQFAAAREVLRAAAMLEDSRAFTPDSDPKAYVESIKQYAVWTRLERWDVRKFADTWIDTTKKRVAAMRGQWTGQMESALRSRVPGRWRDIQTILAVSEAPTVRVSAAR
jgi:hypothetical protein